MFKKSALDIWNDECSNRTIITLSKQLDNAIGVGIPLQTITEFCGTPGSGKSQICLQLCVNIQIPKVLGGLEATAVFIDTNNGFSPNRLNGKMFQF